MFSALSFPVTSTCTPSVNNGLLESINKIAALIHFKNKSPLRLGRGSIYILWNITVWLCQYLCRQCKKIDKSSHQVRNVFSEADNSFIIEAYCVLWNNAVRNYSNAGRLCLETWLIYACPNSNNITNNIFFHLPAYIGHTVLFGYVSIFKSSNHSLTVPISKGKSVFTFPWYYE